MYRRHANIAALCIAWALCTALGFAQDVSPRYSELVRIESEPSGAEVFVGDSLIGATPLTVHQQQLPDITCWYPTRRTWNASMRKPPDSAISHLEGVVVLTFEREIVIHSIPGNASVYSGDSLLGRTPLRMKTGWDSDTLLLVKPWYEQQALIVSNSTEQPAAVVLEPARSGAPPPEVRTLHNGFRFPPARVMLASAVGLAAGAAAVVLKREADARYASYQQYGLETERNASRRYDVYSGLALAVLQLSLAYLIYELFITP